MRSNLCELFARLFVNIPKKFLIGALIAAMLAITLPSDAIAAQSVKIESVAGIANISAGNKQYHQTINAKAGQKIYVAVAFKNMEAAGSGKTAKNVRAKFMLPTQTGTNKTITINISAGNSNTTSNHLGIKANVSGLKFVYTPGTALLWNNSAIHHKISDNVITNKNGAVIGNLGTQKQDTITFYGTLKAPAKPGTLLTNQSQVSGRNNNWSSNDSATPGDTLRYRLIYKNSGNTTAKDVVIKDKMSSGETYVPNSTTVKIGSNKSLRDSSNAIASNGLNLGAFKPGTTAVIEFNAKIANTRQLTCGIAKITNIGIAKPNGMKAVASAAITTVHSVCGTPTCTVFTVESGDNRTATITNFQTSAKNGVTFNKLEIDFGDGATLVTTKPQGKSHQYATSDQRTIHATAHFTQNGQDKSSACPTATVAFAKPKSPTTPTTATTTPAQKLVNTGVGNIFGLFLGATASGFMSYRLYTKRKLSRR